MTDTTPTRRRWYLPGLKDVAWAVALLTIGVGGMWLQTSELISFNMGISERVGFAITFAIALGLFATIGAGFGALLKRSYSALRLQSSLSDQLW